MSRIGNFFEHLARSASTPVGIHVADMIDREPQKWRSDSGHYLCYDGKYPRIWIANGAAYIRVQFEGKGLEMSLPAPDRSLIWRAVKRLKIPSPEQYRMRRAEQVLAGLK